MLRARPMEVVVIRVLIVDDMKILRDCLRMVVNQDEDLEVIGEAGDGKEAVKISLLHHPDVVLMDLKMPVYSGYHAILDIKAYDPSIKILVLSTEENEKNITTAFVNGADGYVLKDIAADELKMLIKKVFYGEKYVHECGFCIGLETMKINQSSLAATNILRFDFTERESEVLELVMDGMTNEEIAGKLGISTGRARNIVTDLISKCMVKNRTQLAVIIAKRKMLAERGNIIKDVPAFRTK